MAKKDFTESSFFQFPLGFFVHGFTISASFRATYSPSSGWNLGTACSIDWGMGLSMMVLVAHMPSWPSAWARQSHRAPGSLSSTLVGFLGA